LGVIGGSANTVSNVTGSIFLPQNPESFWYDGDGNTLSDGRWTNCWDGENRLISVLSRTNSPTASKLRLGFTYDYMGRRMSKKVESFDGSSWTTIVSNVFVYDGWNLIAELNGTNSTLIRAYTWGTDLSGTMQGAGGVGGLISVTVANGPNAGSYCYSYDGNGNVSTLVNAADGIVVAQYEYNPFGDLIAATGRMAFGNPIRFSTKYQDDESGWDYYGYRYYNPSTGRWLCRDPLQEAGGLNCYSFNKNNLISGYDPLGRSLGLDEIFDAVQLAVDLSAGAGYCTIALDVLALAVPFVPPAAVFAKLITREHEIYELVDNAELRKIQFTYWQDYGSRPTKASAVLEYRGRLPNDTLNAPYYKHFRFYTGKDDAAMAYSENFAAQFRPGIGDDEVKGYINEALEQFKRQNKITYYKNLDGYVYDTGYTPGRRGIRLGCVGYADGRCTTKIKLHVGEAGDVHAFPTNDRVTRNGNLPISISDDK
jgi:RHS repeat-associated protein